MTARAGSSDHDLYEAEISAETQAEI